MPFPESIRVIYDHNPLEKVLCQLRFPPILKIDSELPAQFQELIRRDYPLFSQAAEDHLLLPPEISQLAPDLPLMLGGAKSFEFSSSDGIWRLKLTRDFLALACSKYRRWEEFVQHLMNPLAALVKVYEPSFYVRVGLRYINVIRRSELGLEGRHWPDLLRPDVAGELCSAEFGGRIVETSRKLLIDLDQGKVRMTHGIGSRNGKNPEQCYVIDNDFFTEQRTGVEYATKTLDQFHRMAGSLFRWCISDTVHDALGPHLSE